ncbi:hypothetical protein CI109_100098 [Kwoniella shandongensis]|uniref:Citrate transporter-like domain-containing protein n=1 Tax=Kwoniella shandongensis TaxID=1734106 RepID=A0A5M6BR42_9TREE|nr:uncharacterized protein CI109_007245 [Kwoniella shandongensis]KAA5524410.1 hypothetical protein CI109_007245 [Kwoniella shandongensis]
MAVTPLVDGLDRSIDARSIVTLIAFFVVNILVIFPLKVPLPLFVSKWYHSLSSRIDIAVPDLHREVDNGTAAASGSVTLPSSTRRPVSIQSNDDSQMTEKNLGQLRQQRSPRRVYFPLDLRTAPVIGVLILLASTCISGAVVRRGIVGSSGVRPYDIMTLFICFAYISISLDSTGLLRYLAFLVASKSTSHGGGPRLYNSFYAFFAIVGFIFGNDPLILSGTPFLAYFTDHASISPPTAFLFTHFQVSNLVSALLVSSNPTNLVLTSAFGISFLSYSAWLALPTVGAVVVMYPVVRWGIFGGKKKGLIPNTIHPPPMNPRDALVDPYGAVFGASVFIVTVVVLVGLSAGHLLEGTEGVWTVTAPAAAVVMLRDIAKDWKRSRGTQPDTTNSQHIQDNPLRAQTTAAEPDLPASNEKAAPTATPAVTSKKTYHPFSFFTKPFPTTSHVISQLPLALLPFAFSFFILVEGLQHTGWIKIFGGWWGAWEEVGGVAGSVWLMGMLSVIGCNIFGTNIGATILLARVLQYWATTRTVSDRSLYGAVFSLAVGSNFGAYSFVFSASLAGLLWRNILAQKGLFLTMRDFMRWNTIPMVVTMIVGCLVVAGEVCVMYKT